MPISLTSRSWAAGSAAQVMYSLIPLFVALASPGIHPLLFVAFWRLGAGCGISVAALLSGPSSFRVLLRRQSLSWELLTLAVARCDVLLFTLATARAGAALAAIIGSFHVLVQVALIFRAGSPSGRHRAASGLLGFTLPVCLVGGAIAVVGRYGWDLPDAGLPLLYAVLLSLGAAILNGSHGLSFVWALRWEERGFGS